MATALARLRNWRGDRREKPGEVAARRAGGDVSLSVVRNGDGKKRKKDPKRMGRRRTAVLIGVHILFALHFLHWIIAGRTVSPVEPSESMYTLEGGQLNAGFIFFLVAIASTLIFGRFFCGWGCHVIALQDLCGWAMRKIGVRPKPFRSRLLVWVPLLLALYMFVWPTFRRDALVPLFRWMEWDAGLRAIGAVQSFPGFSNHLITDDFWRTFPTLWVAIPFLAVCGFATVYFLGSKGFCTYGCPYGGFFAPAQQAAVGRILVDPDKCKECGMCTAACTSNVRVHEEIKAYGGVVSPGCMKTMDCVAVCPNEALSFGFSKPPMMKGAPRGAAPKRTYDLTWREEFAIAGVFALTFFGTRGIYGAVPMLFAVGLAGCAAFMAWKSWRLFPDPNVRIIGAQLKLKGRMTPGGWAFGALTAFALALVAHSAFINFHRWRGDALFQQVNPARAVVYSGRFDLIPAQMRDRAARALEHHRTASPIARGGWALASTPGVDLNTAWLHLVRGELEPAEEALRRGIEQVDGEGPLHSDLVRVVALRHGADAAIDEARSILAEHPDYAPVREVLVNLLLQRGNVEDAEAALREAFERDPNDARARARLATAILLPQRRVPEAVALLEEAVALAPGDATIRNDLAVALFFAGDVDRAVEEMRRAATDDPRGGAEYLGRAAQMLEQMGRTDDARAVRREIEAQPG